MELPTWSCPHGAAHLNLPTWSCPLEAVNMELPTWTCPLEPAHLNLPGLDHRTRDIASKFLPQRKDVPTEFCPKKKSLAAPLRFLRGRTPRISPQKRPCLPAFAPKKSLLPLHENSWNALPPGICPKKDLAPRFLPQKELSESPSPEVFAPEGIVWVAQPQGFCPRGKTSPPGLCLFCTRVLYLAYITLIQTSSC